MQQESEIEPLNLLYFLSNSNHKEGPWFKEDAYGSSDKETKWSFKYVKVRDTGERRDSEITIDYWFEIILNLILIHLKYLNLHNIDVSLSIQSSFQQQKIVCF